MLQSRPKAAPAGRWRLRGSGTWWTPARCSGMRYRIPGSELTCVASLMIMQHEGCQAHTQGFGCSGGRQRRQPPASAAAGPHPQAHPMDVCRVDSVGRNMCGAWRSPEPLPSSWGRCWRGWQRARGLAGAGSATARCCPTSIISLQFQPTEATRGTRAKLGRAPGPCGALKVWLDT
jgi:hypothetical protein